VGWPNADAVRSTTAVVAIPSAASLPPNVSEGQFLDGGDVRIKRPPLCQAQRGVGRQDRGDGKGRQSGAATPITPGICAPNTTRLAGLEIGSTKLAALAMNAQMKR